MKQVLKKILNYFSVIIYFELQNLLVERLGDRGENKLFLLI